MSAVVRAIRGRCSFCRKSAEEVAGLVAPAERNDATARICSECLTRLVGREAGGAAPGAEGRSGLLAACDFCGRGPDDRDNPSPRICSRCVTAGIRLFGPGATRLGSGTSVGRRQPRIRLNQRIVAVEVRVINHDGRMLGVMQTADARKLARELGLDLVEVNPKASPPVCQILDYGVFRYQQLRDARRRRKAIDEDDDVE